MLVLGRGVPESLPCNLSTPPATTSEKEKRAKYGFVCGYLYCTENKLLIVVVGLLFRVLNRYALLLSHLNVGLFVLLKEGSLCQLEVNKAKQQLACKAERSSCSETCSSDSWCRVDKNISQLDFTPCIALTAICCSSLG